MDNWRNRVFCEDAVKGIARLPDGVVDLILADPPYNLGKDYGNDSDRRESTDYLEWTEAWVDVALKQKRGVITNISSSAGIRYTGYPYASYYAAKGGVNQFTVGLAIQYARDGIRCNVVNPGLIDTPMAAPLMGNPELLNPILSHYPLRRPGKPEEVANMVLDLASDEAAWVTGGTVRIDGGMTIS